MATVFPDSTDRLILVVALAEEVGYGIHFPDAVSAPIKPDPNWSQGAYYGKAEPLDGLTASSGTSVLRCSLMRSGTTESCSESPIASGRRQARIRPRAGTIILKLEAASALGKIASFLAKTSGAN